MLAEDIEVELLFRRLRENDKPDLDHLCSSDNQWKAHFPNHRAWLERALGELNRPGRAAIGAFAAFRTDSGELANRLQACLFLKLSDYDDAAELKNVIVAASFRDEPYRQAVLRALIGKAIRYCEVRDVGKLEIEVPQLEHKLIALFLELGFKVAALRERYLPGRNVCVLERGLGETYCGDPFDVMRIGKWLMRALLPCRMTDSFIYPLNGVDGPPCLVFETYPLHPAFSKGNAQGYEHRARIVLVILDDPWNTESAVEKIIEGSQSSPNSSVN